MYDFPIEYEEPVFRPPSEGKSFLLQVTIGCSNNKCTYCNMYRSKSYRERSLDEIEADLLKTKTYFQRFSYSPTKVFLCDGDALGAPTELLLSVLDLISKYFPSVERVGIYATAQNMLDKSIDELKALAQKKLTIAYLGMESGDDKVLHMIVKGNNAKDMLEGSLKIKEAGIQLSVIAMLGVGGLKHSKNHVEQTAKLISLISPEFFSFLSTVAVPGTPFKTMVDRGLIEELSTKELTTEMYEILKQINGLKNNTLFRANHVSNQFPIGGSLPQDKEKLLSLIGEWISKIPQGVYPEVPPHML
ncbi:radical SAM protein [Halobacteriovorax sp. HLS]|uniref:radical SAM protein n=1 Tax=Halobacteriovorax sp. HLS TaxID=2234000 RepID=UPI000FD7222F|nr:radical SAM protein [Halobacteriovorax sp. HLS]